MKITFYSTRKFEEFTIKQANVDNHEMHFVPTYLSVDTAILAQDSDAVCIFVNDDCSSEVLKQLKNYGVKYVLCRSAGYNHVHLPTAKELGIKVAHVPNYSPFAVAEHTMALMLALNRKIIRANNRVRDLNFSLNGLTGFEMHGKCVGIIGVGTIGAVVAKILHGFGCKLLGFDPHPNQDLVDQYGMVYTDLENLCRKSDIITLHAPLNEHTHYIINEQRIAIMKNDVMLINTSRGGLVDTVAIIEGLKGRQIGYFGLDVYEEETGVFFEDLSGDILQDDVIARLLTLPNVLITSHQGFLTDKALTDIAETTFYNIRCFAQGQYNGYELT